MEISWQGCQKILLDKLFLEDKDYSQGNKPLPELAYEVKLRGVELPVNKDDAEGLGMKVTLLRDVAVASYLSGNRELAIKYLMLRRISFCFC